MDKQKQIEHEELIGIIQGAVGGCATHWASVIATEVLKYYQPKIPEGAVVLTRMETEQRFEDLMVAFDEMGFMPNTTHPFPEEYVETWKQRLIFVFGQLRKETAEKFAEMVSKAFIGLNCIDIDEWNWCQKKIDEICKEITEGKV